MLVPHLLNVFSCVAKVIGKRSRQEELSIIINDGIFNSFGRLLIDDLFEVKNVKNLSNKVNKAEVKVDIFGSSGDDMDILIQNQLMDFDINENDWLFFPDMGAYSIGFDSNLVSVALPSKFGKFRIFTHDDEDLDMNRNDTEKEIKEQRLAIEDLSTSEVVEVIFLDVFGNYSEQQQQSTIDLFEELPGCDEADLWKEYLTNLH